ncbi:MAG: PAS domain-containing protein [Leptolyngbya sp. SIOISBB]|nr:PAS domain-containing protein [Leptolyngbya sp. SIOISBB]
MTCDRPFHDQVPALLQAMDSSGRLTAVTDRWLSWLGYERSSVMGRPWREFLTPTAQLQLAGLTELDWVNDPQADRVLSFRTAQGEVVEAHVAVSLLQDEAGLPTTYLVSLREALSVHQPACDQAPQAAQPVCEKWFELITETRRDVFWIHDAQTRRPIYNSPNFEAVWGLKPEDLQPDLQTLLARIHPDDRETFAASVRDQYTQTAQFENTFRICLPSGEVRWLQEHYFPLLDEQGRPARLVGVTSDITEQQQALLAVAQSEERFQLLAQNLQDVFWLTDMQTGRNLYVNSAFETLWQLPRSALAEDPFAFLQRVHPDDLDRIRATIQTCIAETRDFDVEYRLQLPDGTMRWIRDRGFMILDDMGMMTQMAGIATDITTRKQDEVYLQQYERTIAAIPDAFCLIGQDYRYRLSNAAYQDWFHQGRDVCGMQVADCFGEDFFNTVSKPRCDQALAGHTQCFEEWLYNPHQETAKFISITYAPLLRSRWSNWWRHPLYS